MSRNKTRSSRRGVAAVWLLAAAPALLALLVMVIDVANVWLARCELQNAAESSALASAKLWGDFDDTPDNRTRAHHAAVAMAESNTILGGAVQLADNNNPNQPNNNQSQAGDVLLGDLDGNELHLSDSPPDASRRACLVEAHAQVKSLLSASGIGPYTVNASASAVYDGDQGEGSPRLIPRPVVVP